MVNKWSQDGAKFDQDGAKWCQDGAKLSQDGAKIDQVGEKLRKQIVFQGFSSPRGEVPLRWTRGSGLGKIEIFVKN